MTSRRSVLQFFGAVSGLTLAGDKGCLELLASALAQEERPEDQQPDSSAENTLTLTPEERAKKQEPDPSAENTAYHLFKPVLETLFEAKINLLYEEGYTHSSKKAGDIYVISGSNQSLLVKRVEPYRSNPFSNPVLIDSSVLSLDNNPNGTYTATTGASYIGGSSSLELGGLATPSGSSCYASATGSMETVPGLLRTVKSWQDAYDGIFRDAKSIFHAQDGLSRKQKLENILHLYQQRFPELADLQRWQGLTISTEAKTILTNLGTTYDLDDVAQSLMNR